MQLSVRSMFAAGVSATVAATIALAPLPTESLPSTHTAPVVLTGAWEGLQANIQQDLANLQALIVAYPTAPILTQLATNLTTYSRWIAGQDGGNPLTVVQTVGEHVTAVANVLVTYSLLVPLSFVGPLIAPVVTMFQLVADTAGSPSTPQTVLQALVDAPAVFLNTAFYCCSTPLFKLAFGLLNPGPLGYLLSVGPSIAGAMQIPPAPEPEPPAAAAAAVKQPAPGPGVAQSRRTPSVTSTSTALTSRTAKRPNAPRKATARETASSPGKGRSARSVRSASPETR